MEDKAISAFKYHVASFVPDFQTKLADSRPIDPASFDLSVNGGGERISKFYSLVVLSGREKAQAFRPMPTLGPHFLISLALPYVLQYCR
jgi:hypothetical protein